MFDPFDPLVSHPMIYGLLPYCWKQVSIPSKQRCRTARPGEEQFGRIVQRSYDRLLTQRLPWFERKPERVAEERRLLRTFGLEPEFFQDRQGSLSMVFRRPHGRIEVRTGRDHPHERPSLSIHTQGESRPRQSNGFRWDAESYIYEIVAPLIGPQDFPIPPRNWQI